MTRSRQSARTAGATFERQTADYLATALNDDRIDRRIKYGQQDRGDITGITIHGQRIVIECKNQPKKPNLPEWINEAHLEAGNDDALIGLVIAKRNGTANPAKQWVIMETRDLVALITGEKWTE